MYQTVWIEIRTDISDSLDSDQDRRYVGPDLGSNCLHRLSAVDKSAATKERMTLCMCYK